MNPDITPEMVEAVAKAMMAADTCHYKAKAETYADDDDDGVFISVEDDTTDEGWGQMRDQNAGYQSFVAGGRDHYRGMAKAALEAAAPLIWQQVRQWMIDGPEFEELASREYWRGYEAGQESVTINWGAPPEGATIKVEDSIGNVLRTYRSNGDGTFEEVEQAPQKQEYAVPVPDEEYEEYNTRQYWSYESPLAVDQDGDPHLLPVLIHDTPAYGASFIYEITITRMQRKDEK